MLYEITGATAPPRPNQSGSGSTPATSAGSCAAFEKLGLIREAVSQEMRGRASRLTARPQGVRAARGRRRQRSPRARAVGAGAGAAGRGDADDRDAARAQPRAEREVILRAPRPGDLGWIVARHGLLYAQEYGWTETSRPVREIVAEFVATSTPRASAAGSPSWTASVGSVMLVKDRRRSRGFGFCWSSHGARARHRRAIVDECISFARQAGYRKITLWTHGVLTAARKIYEKAGFRLIASEPRGSWGKNVVSEYWDMKL